MMTIDTKRCPFCGIADRVEVDITQEQYGRWLRGELIQNAMPNVPAEVREQLISGIHPECWDNEFGRFDE